MSGPTPDFIALVKDALEHIYDPARLEQHSLAQALLPEHLPPGVSRAEALRQALLDGIVRLDPGSSAPAGSRQHRIRRILELRYVEALPYRQVMGELALSQPQYHRDQRRAVEAFAALLYETARDLSREQAPPHVELPPPCAEMDAAVRQGETVIDLREVADGVVEMLRQVARNRGVALSHERPASPALVRGSRTAMRQLMISLIGWLLGGAGGAQLVLSTRAADGDVAFSIVYRGIQCGDALQAVEAREGLEDAEQLLQSLGGVLSLERVPGSITVNAKLPGRHRLLLVIDDNPDAVQLISRFVADQAYVVLGAGNVPEGLKLARSARPDVILLDIMIPEQDGWDALQTLKHDPATQDIPVLVCTVLRESGLALALGADEFIRKPLTLPGLLQALARWTHFSPPRVGESRG